MRGYVVYLYVALDAGLPMREVAYVNAIKGVGLAGDRYAGDRGAFSKSGRPVIRQVTLIELEAIEKSKIFKAIDTRRNIVVRNFPLNNLVGKEFQIGNIRMRGVELCEPCARPSMLCGKKGFKEALDGSGGLRAEILDSGQIITGDACTRFGDAVSAST